MHPLFETSRRMKVQADRILKESKLVEILQGYGEVKILGSYALDLMLRPDLDLFVVTPKQDWENVLKLHAHLMKQRYFRDLNFANWIDFPDPTVKQIVGYYFQPRIPIDNELWKLDIWLVTPDQDRSAELTGRFQKLLTEESDDTKRRAILEIKQAMREGKKYVPGVDGNLIYSAVLDHGVRNVDEFKVFLANHPI